jgi:hypothetical protein
LGKQKRPKQDASARNDFICIQYINSSRRLELGTLVMPGHVYSLLAHDTEELLLAENRIFLFADIDQAVLADIKGI